MNGKTKRFSSRLTALALAFLFVLQPIAPALAEEAAVAAETSETRTTVGPEVTIAASALESAGDTDAKAVGTGVEEVEAGAAMTSMLDGSIPPQVDSGNPMSFAAASGLITDVDKSTGALVYEYPLFVPPGREKMQPDLVLGYNSQKLERNFLGAGWDVEIPSIERVNRNGLGSFYSGNLFSSTTDGELVDLGSGQYGAKVENGNFVKYAFSGGVWTATDKVGTTYTFGATAAARQDDPNNSSHVFKWMLQEVRDRNDNFIKYEYYKDQGQIYPASIKYTGSGTTDGPFEVIFLTGTRPDAGRSYATGFLVVTGRRIVEIQAKVGGVLRHKHVFGYGSGDNGSRSLLTSIIETGYDEQGTPSIRPAATFGYQDTVPGWTLDGGWTAPIRTDYYGNFVFDMDGDAKSDLIHSFWSMTNSADYYNRESYSNNSNKTWIEVPAYDSPLIMGGPGYVINSEANYARVAVSDVNGDGLSDLLADAGFNLDGQHGSQLNTGNGWQDASQWDLPFVFDNSPFPIDREMVGHLGDLNGDGLVDLFRASQEWNGQDLYVAETVYLNTGSGWQLDEGWDIPIQLVNDGLMTIDVNGDGLVDLLKSFEDTQGNNPPVYTQVAYINTGNRSFVLDENYEPPVVFLSYFQESGYSNYHDHNVRAIDLNDDGLVDLTKAESPVATYLNTGSGWTSVAYWEQPCLFRNNAYEFQGECRVADLNGDGMIDLFRSELSYQDVIAYPYLHNGKKADLLTKATLAEGGEIRVEYRAAAEFEDSQNTPLNPDLFFPLQVVASVEKDDGNGLISSTKYRYTGGKYYFDGYADRRFAGFSRVEEIGGAGNTSRNFYHQGDTTNSAQGEYSDHLSKIGKVYRSESGSVSSFAAVEIDQQQEGFPLSDTKMMIGPGFPWSHPYSFLSRIRFYGYNEHSGAACAGVIRSCAYFDDADNPVVCADTSVYVPPRTYGNFWVDFQNPSVGNPMLVNLSQMTGFQIVEQVVSGQCTDLIYETAYDPLPYSGTQMEHRSDRDARFTIERKEWSDGMTAYSKQINKWDRADLGNGRSFVKLAQRIEMSVDGDADHRDKAETYAYDDANGNLTSRVEWGEVTAADDGTFTDTGADKYTTVTAYVANTPAHIFGLPSQETVTNQSSVKVRESRRYYDDLALGSVDKGNETKTEHWVSGTSYVDTEKTYNTYGLVTQEKDPRDKATNYSYDSLYLYPATVTNAANHSTAYVYDYALGKPKQVTDPNGFVYQTIFDGLGRVTAEKQPDPASPSTLVNGTTYSYTNLAVGLKTQRTDWLDAATGTDVFTYTDGLGRVIQERRRAEAANTYAATDTVYNNLGQVAKKSLPYFSTGADRTAATTTGALYTAFSYDPLMRVTSAVDAVGTTSTAYDDWKTTVTDANGHLKDTYADAYGRLAQVGEHNGASTYTTAYSYDYGGNLTGLTDALGNVRAFTHDGLGRRLTAQDLHAPGDATFGTWSYAYDASGNMEQRTDAKGQVVNYTYDDLNRALTEDWTGGTGTEVTYSYDTCQNGLGRLCSSVNADVTQTNGYDALGRVIVEIATIAGVSYTTAHEYDRQGHETLTTHPDGSQVKNIFSVAGFLNQTQRKETTDGGFVDVVTNIDYAPTSQPTVTSYANGMTATNTYDAAHLYRLTRKLTTGFTTAPPDPVTVSFYPTAGDGIVYRHGSGWAEAHDATSGTVSVTGATKIVGTGMSGETYFRVDRGFFPFDTSSIPDNATVTAASLKVYVVGKINNDDDGDDWLTVVQSTQMSVATLAGTDYPEDGAVTDPVEGIDASARPDITNVPTYQFLSIPLNATGRSWVNLTGPTRFGLREGHDALNHAFVGSRGQYDRITLRTSEYSGTTYDPVLTATYTMPATLAAMTSDVNYTYDPVGNITQIIDASATATAKTVAYTYDPLDRLLTATATNVAQGQDPYAETYTYDAIGNVTSGPAGAYLYQGDQGASYANPHAATSVGGVGRVYDQNGSLGFSGVADNYAWDWQNRLASFTTNGHMSAYAYDPSGRRVKLTEDGTMTAFPSGGYEVTGGVPTKHLDANGALVATVKGSGALALPRYVATDHLTGAGVTTNQDASLAELLDYLPYGALRIDEKHGGADERRKYAGHEYDATTGLSYMGARYYDGSTGRFLSQDQAFLALGDRVRLKAASKMDQEAYLANPQFLNSYSYSLNNPVTYRDANGNFPILAAAAAYAVAYAPVWVPAALTAVSATGAAVATWFWGSAVGHMIEGNHQAANQSLDKMEATLQITAAGTAGVMAADELLGNQNNFTSRQNPANASNASNNTGSKVPSGVQSTLNRINAGEKLPYRNDGAVFQNREGLLPRQDSGYYHEYVHPTPNVSGPGAQRVVTGRSGEAYYTSDHYKSFTQVKD